MFWLDSILTYVGIVYGFVLIMVFFVRNAATEAFRIDALITPNPSDSTRSLNLIAGLLVAGYSIYSLIFG